MALTTLLNTIWVFNDTINVNSSFNYSVNFTYYGKTSSLQNFASHNGSSLSIVSNVLKYDTYSQYSKLKGWDADGNPQNQGLSRYIKFTGGTDIENASLIAWISKNAKQISSQEVWQIKQNASYDLLNFVSASFTSNNETFSHIDVRVENNIRKLRYDSSVLSEIEPPVVRYYNSALADQTSYDDWNYKSLNFASAVTDTTLLTWLNNNAIRLSTTNNLTNTKWEFFTNVLSDALINTGSVDLTFNINFTCGDESFTSISLSPNIPGSQHARWGIKFNNTVVFYSEYNEGGTDYVYVWNNEKYKNIIITGGNDASNEALIAWFYNVAHNYTIAVYEKIRKNGKKVQVDSAIRDGNGAKIDTNYAKKAELNSYVKTTELDTRLSDYSTTTQMNTAISAHHDTSKQDTLTDGSAININSSKVINVKLKTTGSGLDITDGLSVDGTIATKTYAENYTDTALEDYYDKDETDNAIETAVEAYHDDTKLNVSGGTMTGDITFGNSGDGLIGAGELQINATNDLVLGGANIVLDVDTKAYYGEKQANNEIATKADLATKQDTLSSGDGINIINNTVGVRLRAGGGINLDSEGAMGADLSNIVVANPADEGSANLSKLKVGNVIYNVPDTTYTEGDGIDINNTEISVNLADNGGLEFDANGLLRTDSTIALKSEIPTSTSDLDNDSGYITINDVPQELFWCTYGTTTYAQIKTALTAGKLPICKYGDNYYIFSRNYGDTSYCYFNASTGTGGGYIQMYNTDNSWEYQPVNLENASNKVTSLSSSSTNTQYPGALATYNAIINHHDSTKQNTLTDGDGINITNNTISVALKDNGGLAADGNGALYVDDTIATKNDLPTNVSELDNDSGYQTAANVSSSISSALTNYATKTYVDDATDDMATQTWVNAKGYITDVSGKLDKKTTTGLSAYTHNGTTQSEINIASNNAANSTLVQRTSAGAINTATPTANTHATTKKYVDDADTALDVRVQNLEARGRYLSGWNCTTGKPNTYPPVPSGQTSYTYTYKTGDYFVVTNATTGSATSANKKPSGTTVSTTDGGATWTISSVSDGGNVIAIGDYYIYDGNGTWNLIHTDTNTHRPIQMNGTEILGNNVTPLNLKAGQNISLSNSSGTVTVATDTAIPTNVSELTNDSDYQTGTAVGASISTALVGYATQTYVNTATNDMATKTWVGNQGYVTGSYLPISGGTLTGALTVTGNTYPASDNTYTIGDASKRYRYIWGRRVMGIESLNRGTSAGTNQMLVPDEQGTIASREHVASNYLALSGGNLTGSVTSNNNTHIQAGTSNVTGSNSATNYISAGIGYSNTSGREGVKIVCCDQSDCVSGLGQDLGSNSGKTVNGYNFSIAGCNNSSDKGSISFVTHVKGNTTYRELAYFDDNAGTVKFDVLGTMYQNGNAVATQSWVTSQGYLTSHQSLANYVTLDGEQTISGKKTFTGSMKVSGRYNNAGDDEGIIVGTASNNYAGLCLGNPNGERSVFYLCTASGRQTAFWRYNNGSNTYDLRHPGISGTIATTSYVQANPSDSAISNISKIKIGSTVYNISGGSGGGLPTTGGVMTGNITFSNSGEGIVGEEELSVSGDSVSITSTDDSVYINSGLDLEITTQGSATLNGSAIATASDLSGKLSKTEQSSISVAGTTKNTTVLGGNTLVAPNGLVMSGTAESAGLVTRGVCGVTSPSSTGACTKDNLFINYDGVDTYNTGRQMVLQAGSVGTHYGNNLYQYCVPRGDVVKAWVEAKGYLTGTKYNANNPNTFIGYNSERNEGATFVLTFKNNDNQYGLAHTPFVIKKTSSSTPSATTENGFYYVSSEESGLSGANANPFLQYHSEKDFRILTTAYSDSWLQQIATDFRSNYVFFRRKQNGTWQDWRRIDPEATHRMVYDSTDDCIKFVF